MQTLRLDFKLPTLCQRLGFMCTLTWGLFPFPVQFTWMLFRRPKTSFSPWLTGIVYNIPQNQLDCSQAAESAGLVVYFCLIILILNNWAKIVQNLAKILKRLQKNLKRLPTTWKDCQKLEKIAKNLKRLPKSWKDCQKLEKIAKTWKDCQKLAKVFRRVW